MTMKRFGDLPDFLKEKFGAPKLVPTPPVCSAREVLSEQHPVEFEDGSLGWEQHFIVVTPENRDVTITARIVGQSTGLLGEAKRALELLQGMTAEAFSQGGDNQIREILSQAIRNTESWAVEPWVAETLKSIEESKTPIQ